MSQKSDGYQPQTIVDQPIPLLNGEWTDPMGSMDGSESGGVISPTIPDIKIPQGIVAADVIATSLDTSTRVIKGNYTFEQMGAIQIGTSSNGILISPAGILGIHLGSTTFSLDTNGNAYFKGTVAAGSVVTGYLTVGGAADDINGNTTTIDGGKITTGSVTASQIQAGTITATQISGSYVYAGNLNASQITAGNIAAARIQTNVLSALQASISNLSSISANIGTITAGSINAEVIGSGLLTTTNAYLTSGLRIGGSPGSTNGISVNGSFHAVGGGQLILDNDIGMNGHNINGANGIYLNGHFLTNGSTAGHLKIDGVNIP